jgi:hypothetical protein
VSLVPRAEAEIAGQTHCRALVAVPDAPALDQRLLPWTLALERHCHDIETKPRFSRLRARRCRR